MEKGTWVKFVGVTGVILGVTGILSGLFVTGLASFRFYYIRVMAKYGATYEASSDPGTIRAIENLRTFWETPPGWFIPVFFLLGLLGLFIASLYISGSVRLMRLKQSAFGFLLIVVSSSVGLEILRTAVYLSVFRRYWPAYVGWGFAGLLLDGIFFVLLFTLNRDELDG